MPMPSKPSPTPDTSDKPTQTESTTQIVPTLQNLFCKEGELQWPVFAITNVQVGPYTVDKIVSENGSHGLVASCVDINGTQYAMKIERQSEEMSTDTIAYTEIFTALKDTPDLHIPRLIQSFQEDSKEILVMELLGPDLFVLNNAIKGPMSPKTVLQIGISLLTAYEQMHEAGWLHLTTKPVNYCIGGTPETRQKIYIVDFGRAQKYRVIDDKGDVKHRDRKPYVEAPQTPPYFSFWSQAEITCSRRDDLNSISVMLLLLATPTEQESRWRQKYSYSETWAAMVDFCDGGQTTTLKPVDEMLMYTMKLKYDEKPDYAMLRRSMELYAKEEGITLDGKYDWDDMIVIDEQGKVTLKEEPAKEEEVKEEDEVEEKPAVDSPITNESTETPEESVTTATEEVKKSAKEHTDKLTEDQTQIDEKEKNLRDTSGPTIPSESPTPVNGKEESK
jgi:serine/threonine protein kinase